MVCEAGELLTLGIAFTVAVKVTGNPVQPFARGIKVITAVFLIAAKDGISVTPVLFASPIEAPPDRSKTTPAGVPDNGITGVATPLQNDRGPGEVTVGTGLTISVTAFEVAGLPDLQVSLEVRATVIISLLTGI